MRNSGRASGWRGIVLIAVVYVYFLIFAQFAFLARLAEFGLDGNSLKLVMACMAAGGILLSLLVPRVRILPDAALRLRLGLGLSAAAAVLTIAPLSKAIAAVVALVIGAGLGITTVTLVTHLRIWTGRRGGILHVGIGTGIAYFVCNVPAVFTATPRIQAVLAAALCAIAIAIPMEPSEVHADEVAPARTGVGFAVALFSFAALIWLDSAAFYIIQHTPALKAETWLGNAHLWLDGCLHFGAAIIAAVLLQQRRFSATLALAFAALGFACVLLRDPALVLSASLFYPIGVSLYSVALVGYPSFLANAESAAERGRQAGWIYAVAGWIGSALGIGMGQNLGRVPMAFIVVAGTVVLVPASIALAKNRPRELALIASVPALAFFAYRILPEQHDVAALTSAERGREVYISEGCISCHSQYVRPDSPDALIWGPVQSLDQIHAQRPPLIGNRRQGPDLTQVGWRRSPLWLKAHLVSPAEVSFRSPMPSFAFLFRDRRGDDLVAYLASLRGPGEQQQLAREAIWQPSAAAWRNASPAEGEAAYREHCATCHDAQGVTRMHWMSAWHKVPPDLPALRSLVKSDPKEQLARIAKFGTPGTDMPGHEYLSDAQIASVAMWLKLSNQDAPQSSRQ